MEIRAFIVLVIPFILVFYLAVLLFLRPPRAVLVASLAGGLLMGGINLLIDLVAYHAHWWHYTLNELILHVPLPLYISPVLIYGSVAFLLIWRFWLGSKHRFARMLLIGTPIFGILRDVWIALTPQGYIVWESPLAAPLVVLMWLAMFYGSYLLFKRLTPVCQMVEEQEQNTQAKMEKTS
jgi:hypothetical protein